MLRVYSEDDSKLDVVISKVDMLLHVIDSAEASMQHFDSRAASARSNGSNSPIAVRVNGEEEKSVLILGAGMVAGSCAEYLGRSKSTTVVVASKFEDEAMAVAANAWRGKAFACDLSKPCEMLSELIREADVVVSLLPAPMHPAIAMECIKLKTDLVTASYESDDMRSLRTRYEPPMLTSSSAFAALICVILLLVLKRRESQFSTKSDLIQASITCLR